MAGDCAGSRDDGYFAVGWLGRIVVTFAIVGVLAMDGSPSPPVISASTTPRPRPPPPPLRPTAPRPTSRPARAAAEKAAQDADTTLTDLTFSTAT